MGKPSTPNQNPGLTYEDSGVSIDSGEEVVSRIKDLARSTFTPDTLSDLGSFGALYDAQFPGTERPALVSSADGVGTKLKVAFMTGQHKTVGEDLVNHCINDILAQGARPLFFLDYFATGELEPDNAVDVISGIARACKSAGVAFIGGETAEMPSMYAEGEYDLAGFIVGVVDKEKIVDGSEVRKGDQLIGIPSNGLHTNGYSLARRAIFDVAGRTADEHVDELHATIGQALLKPHLCYLAPVTEALSAVGHGSIHGMAHITGGGIAGNLSRVIPEELQARVDLDSVNVPEIFGFIQKCGSIEDIEMYKAFNMGVGYILVVSEEAVDEVMSVIERHSRSPMRLGAITKRKSLSDSAVELV